MPFGELYTNIDQTDVDPKMSFDMILNFSEYLLRLIRPENFSIKNCFDLNFIIAYEQNILIVSLYHLTYNCAQDCKSHFSVLLQREI